MSLRIAFRHAYPACVFDVDFAAPTPGVTVLFGPSGAGKSTIAAVAAGLLRPVYVHVQVDGAVLADSASGVFVQPERRRVGTVFQDARLFPHLNVASNLRYGLSRAPSGKRICDWTSVTKLLDLAGLLHRRPATLSGGERQRVAIGRTLLSQPRLLVMDEPLASLEGQRRAEILPYLAGLRDSLELPILYVTHAVDEVARLADTLVLVERGRSIAVGPVSAMTARTDLALATENETGAVIACQVAGPLPQRGLTRLLLDEGEGLELLVPLLDRPVGRAVRVMVSARDVIIATERPPAISVQNILPAMVTSIAVNATNGSARVEMRLGNAPLLAHITGDAVTRLGIAPGLKVLALIKSVSVTVLS